MKLGILAVSFGTTHLDTLDKAIRPTEEALSAAFSDAVIYRAFTSGMVRKRLERKFDIHVDSVAQAMERMRADGVDQAVIQTTLLIPGEEYDLLRREVLANAGGMETVLGQPLLWDDSDLTAIMDILAGAYPLGEEEALVMMGHGTRHAANDLYTRLDQRMERRGGQMVLTTVEGTPSFQDAIAKLKARPYRKVQVAPLLLVAGDHAKNDMAGDRPDSLRRCLESEGFQVTCHIRGLGELSAVRERIVRRAKAAYETLEGSSPMA